MPTKFSRFCSGVMEAAWLAAVSVIPIFFNIYSSRIFEPDKITILRSLALITLAAWILKIIEDGGIRWKDTSTEKSFGKFLWKFPMFAPVLGLIIIFIISTVFSVTPAISFLGSYQRLQGTYTTFSYLIIFASLVINLRNKYQINRLITTVILASLPVSFYGLLQRYQIDPIPWGGNVSIRIASTMGNSIFVAAYLIMVFPLTFGRTISAFKEILSANSETEVKTIGIRNVIKASIYVFILLLELIAIYMSGSRGPLLGLMAGTYLLVLLLSIYWNKRWLTIGIVALAIFGAVFLIIFNINKGPLESLKKSPYIGRFGLLLDPESNSALVRQYIWEGTVKLVEIHQPIKFPNGKSDSFNFIRPFIGYGPESMYVAYNQFYQPELGQVEKRNASPDRSHNETWDSIVITGLIGLGVYLAIFGSVFFYGLNWLGFIKTGQSKTFFFVCLFGGGLIGVIVLIIMKGVEFLGIGLPFGMIFGLITYLTIVALFSKDDAPQIQKDNPYALLMITIFAAIIGHFAEINFGIAIVATRTLFWTYTGVLVVVGYILPKVIISEKTDIQFTDENNSLNAQIKKKRAGRQQYNKSSKASPQRRLQPQWMQNSFIFAIILTFILITLGYDFISNSGHSTSFSSVLIDSFSRLPNKDNQFSLGVLALILTTWIIGVLLYSTETYDDQTEIIWSQSIVIIAAMSFGAVLIFYLLHTISLASLAGFVPQNEADVITQVNNIGSLLTKYYINIFVIIILGGIFLLQGWALRWKSSNAISMISAPIIMIIIFSLINITNLKVIHADITFKMAEPFSRSGSWQVATALYKYAQKLAPREDHYYLFLGRSYLEQAKLSKTSTDQENLIHEAENDLKEAQSINPLNTDHTANLARLYSWWAGQTTTLTIREERAQTASNYYATAVTLSPNNSTLWDEWAGLYMQVYHQPQKAFEKLQYSYHLDAKYSVTNGMLGDYYIAVASAASDISPKVQALQMAAEYYRTAANVTKITDTTPKINYLASLGNVYLALTDIDSPLVDKNELLKQIDQMIESSKTGVNKDDQWKIQEILAKIYFKLDDKTKANFYGKLALQNAPEIAVDRIQQLLTQIQSMP